jgi:O-antigen/teichoic acid export membrane protein
VRKEFVKPDCSMAHTLLRKGFFLFLYNGSFNLIMLVTRSMVSFAYTDQEFATFSFALILANTIMLLFESFNFLIYPKTINRFSHAKGGNEILRILNLIRVNYITSVHLMMYVFILLYPLFIVFIPKYSSSSQVFTLLAMTVVFYSNCFVFSSLLTALGREKLLSVLSITALAVNAALGLLLVYGIKTGYEYVILSTLVAYLIYNIMLWYASFRRLQMPVTVGSLLKDNFPLRLFLPFGICLAVAIMGFPVWLYFGVLFLFIILNRKQLTGIKDIVMRVINDSSILNI